MAEWQSFRVTEWTAKKRRCHMPTLFCVRMAGKDGEGAVQLLGEDDTGEFVRHGEGGKRNSRVSVLGERGRKTIGVAAKKNKFLGAAVAEVTEPAGELRRGELLAGGVEEDECGGGVELEIAERGRRSVAQLGGGHAAIVADAEKIVVEKSANFGAASFANE